MKRHIKGHLDACAAHVTESERVLQRQLAQPLSSPEPRQWLRRAARVFTGLFIAQTLLAAMPASAQITAAPMAPSGQKPLIDAAANGTPIVLIAPPSKAGVSRNQYEQFNVGPKGLILNNSTGRVQTQIGGGITGNPQLGLTPARIILNEVTGPNASQLKGTIEVGGQRADIVIANPNGITCDGCGFLNSDRATLTTGKPQFDGRGAITGLDVRQGLITVGPDGLNATEQQQLEFYARGMVIEGEIDSQNLRAVIGANQVLYGTLNALPQATGQEGAGDAPRFAIDIKALGGMYAGQIYLIATDKGLGVNSLGRTATLAGNMVLSANGDLTLKDTYSSRDARIASSGRTTLTGQTLAAGTVTIDAPQGLSNSGAVQANSLKLNTLSIANSGTITQTAPGERLALALPGGLQNSGQIYTAGDLSVQAEAIGNVAGGGTGQLIAEGSLQVTASSVQLSGQHLAANGDISVSADTLSTTGGSVTAGAGVALDARGALKVSGTSVSANGQARFSGNEIALDHARIGAGGNVQIASAGVVAANAAEINSNEVLSVQGRRVDIRSATLTAASSVSVGADGPISLVASQLAAGQRVDVRGQAISTAAATLSADKISIDAGEHALDNEGGKVQASSSAADALMVQAHGISNRAGELRANGGLTLDARGGTLDNAAGVVASRAGTLANLRGLSNAQGLLYTQGDLTIAGSALNNSGGRIVTAGSLAVTTPGQTIDNTAGVMQAGKSVSLDSANANFANDGGVVVAGADLSVKAGALDGKSATLTAGGALSITAADVQASGAAIGSGGAMRIAASGSANLGAAKIDAGSDLSLQAAAVIAADAHVASNGNLRLAGVSVSGGHWSAQGDLSASSAGQFDVSAGSLLAGGNVSVHAQGITTDHAQVSARNLIALDAGSGAVSNVAGQIVAGGTIGKALSISGNGINNSGGILSSAADASLDAGARPIDNTGGQIVVAGKLQLQGSDFINHGGVLSMANSLDIRGVALDNKGGTIQTRGSLALDTGGQTLDNTAGKLIAGGNITLQAATLGNEGGTIAADGSTRVQARDIDTTHGRISGTAQLDVMVTQRLAAGAATLASEGQVAVTAGQIAADGAAIMAGKSVVVTAEGDLDLREATISAQGPEADNIRLGAASIAAGGATINGGAGVALASAADIDVIAASISANKALTLQAGEALKANAATVATNDALILAGATVTASGAALSAGGSAQVIASAGGATLDQARLLAGDAIKVAASGITAANASVAAVNDVTIDARSGDFTAPGVLVQSQVGGISVKAAKVDVAGSASTGAAPSTGLLAGGGVSIQAAGSVNVSGAATNAGSDVTIDASGAVMNDGGRLLAGSSIGISAASLSNRAGVIDANGAIHIVVANGAVNNDRGRISTRDVLTMGTAAGPLAGLSNAGGVIETSGPLDVELKNFNNRDGRVTALAGLTLSAGSVDTTNGLLASDGNVRIDTQGGALAGDNSRVLSTRGNVSLSTGMASLNQASVLAQGGVILNATGLAAAGASVQANTGSVRIDVGGGNAGLDGAQLLAAQHVLLAAGASSLDSATVSSGANTTLSTGTLQASGARFDSQGDFSAAASTVAADGAVIAAAGNAVIAATHGIDLARGGVSAQRISLDAGNGSLNNASGRLTASADTGAAMTLRAEGLSNQGGVIASNADLDLNAGAATLENAAGKVLAVGAADIRSTGLGNVAGTVASNGDLAINAAQAQADAAADSTGGTIQSGRAITLTAGATMLANGHLTSGGNTTLTTGALQANQARIDVQGNFVATASGAVTADHIALAAGGAAQVTAAGGIAVSEGSISARTIYLQAGAGSLNNTGGSLIASGTGGTALILQGEGIANAGGNIASSADLAINAGAGSLGNTSGSILALGAADIRATGLNNQGGIIASNAELHIDAAQANANASVDSSAGTIRSGRSITLAAGDTTLTGATLTSGGDATLITGNLQASQARINVQGDFSATSSGSVIAVQSTVAAGGGVAITAARGVDVSGGDVSANTVRLDAGAGVVNNIAGRLVATGATGTALILQGNGLRNDQGAIASGADLVIDVTVGRLTNAAGSVMAVGAADLRSTGLDNRAGLIASNGNLTLNAAATDANAATDSTGGALQSGGNISLTAGDTTLTGATLTSGRNITLSTGKLQASQALVNVQGDFSAASSGAVVAGGLVLAAGGAASISAVQGIDINHGHLSAQTLDLRAGHGVLDNTAGSLIATATVGTALTLQATGLSNDAGTVASGAGMAIDSGSGSLTNATGTIQSVGGADIRSTGLNNRAGTIAANGDLAINAVQANADSATDSTDGSILSAGSISLTAGATTLTNATVTSGGNMNLQTGALQASHASINAQGSLVATAGGTFDADHASIAAGGDVALTALRGMDLHDGSVSGAKLRIDAGSGALNNIAGSILALGTADIRSTGLINVDGTITSNGALTVIAQADAGAITDNTRGILRSTQSSIALTTGELLNNRAGSTDGGSVINAATDLSIDASGAVNNGRSEISAGGNLRISAAGTFNNEGARVVAGQDLTLGASALDNTSGLIAGNGNAAVTTTGGDLTNTSGVMQAAHDLVITSAGAVTNTGGKLMAGNQLGLTGGALTNSLGEISAQTGNVALDVSSYSAGTVVAGGSLSLDTHGGALAAKGATLSSGGDMTLRAGATQINDASLTAGGSLDARASSVQALGADVQAAGHLSFDAGTGAFNAQGSHWQAGQSLSLAGGALTLTDAAVAANTSVSVAGASVDATRAIISSPGDVSVIAANGALNLGDATLLAGRDLTATGTGAGTTAGVQALAGRDLTLSNGGSFDFSAAQLQVGRDLSVQAQGISTAGQQLSVRNLTLDAGGGLLDNQGATLAASGTINASGTGVNNQGSVIAADGQVSVSAGNGTLNNASGRIFSTQESVVLSGATIDNTQGLVSAAQDVSLTGGSLANIGGTAIAGGSLTATFSGAVNNAGGRLVANTGSASVSGSDIDNQSGTIAGATLARVDAGSGTLRNTGGLITGSDVAIGGAVNNSAGVISGSNSVAMTTLALNNDAGVIESGTGGIAIDTQGNTLTNTNSGNLRGIVSEGAITIAAGDIDNRAGYIGANGGLNITASSSIDNRAGTLLGLGNSAITTTGTLNNQGGSILGGADLAVSAGTLNNSNGGTIYAARDLSVSAGAIDNTNTRNDSHTTGLLAGGNATITAGTLDNTNGAIVALGDISVRATTSLNNTQGQIAGRNVTIDSPVFTNTGGRVDAQDRLTLRVPQFSADGVLASNGAMNLQLQGDYVNSGTVSANGDLNIATTGSYTNQGHLSAQNNLSLTASAIDNQAIATIDSRSTTLSTTGTLNNAGLINSTAGQTSLTAGTLNNTGRIYGDSIVIAGTTNNSTGAGGAAVIASRGGDVTFNGQLNNTDGAQVFSLGSIQVNGSVRNDGSTINALRDVGITGTLANTNARLTTGTATWTEAVNEVYITPSGSPTQYKLGDLGWRDGEGGLYVLPSSTYPIAAFGIWPLASGMQTSCPATMDPTLGCPPHYTYPNDDPVWALFGVVSPSDIPAPDPSTAPACTVLSPSDGSAQRTTMGSCGPYWDSVDAYDAAVSGRQAQLDTAIVAFNADVESRIVIDWYETTVTSRTTTETTVVTPTQPGYVLAGGNISAGGGINQDSVIIAGGTIDFAGSNEASKGTQETLTSGTMVFNHRVWHGVSGSYTRDISAPQDLPPVPQTSTFDLPILQFTPNGNPAAPSSGGTSTPVGGPAASLPGIGAAIGGSRGATPAGGTTGTTETDNPFTSANPLQVGSTTIEQPHAGVGVSNAQVSLGTTVKPGGADPGTPAVMAIEGSSPVGSATVGAIAANAPASGTAVTTGAGSAPAAAGTVAAASAATPAAANASTITAGLSAAAQGALPGSVIAAGVRAGQLTAITTSLVDFGDTVKALPVVAVVADTSARVAPPLAVKAAGYTTVRAAGAVRAPASQLFILNRNPRGPLIETDPAFTGGRSWTSSASMFSQLAMDPERSLKLYGDGFAEQRLIDEQILALSGRRFLSGYDSTEDEYGALLDAGVMYARQYQLTPGVALSAEQMALLTTDIVWLEPRTVSLPDGSTVQALVPTVYLRRPIAGDLAPTGALIAGSNVTLRSPGDLANSGTIIANGDAAQGNGKLTVAGVNIANSGTLAGNVISVAAQQTLNNAGGVIQGLGPASSASLNARDIILRTTTQSSVASIEGANGLSTGSRTNVDRIATVAADSVRIAALNDITLTGAVVKAGNDAVMTAGGKIVTGTVQQTYTLDLPLGGAGGTQGGRSGYFSEAATTHLGTQISSGGSTVMLADGAVNLTGAGISAGSTALIKGASVTIDAALDQRTIDQQGASKSGYERLAQSDQTLSGGVLKAGGDLTVMATNGDINARGAQIVSATGRSALIATGEVNVGTLDTQHSTSYELAKSSQSGSALGLDSRTSSLTRSASTASVAEGSLLAGNTIVVRAGTIGPDGKLVGGNVAIVGSSLLGQKDVSIAAGNNVSIEAATHLLSSSSEQQSTSSGLGAMGGLSYGTREQSRDQTTSGSSASASTVGSVQGNVSITAGNHYSQVGSDVLTPGGDVVIDAKSVRINEARETQSSQSSEQFRQSGVSVSASNPVIDALQTAGQVSRAASRTEDPRAQALAAATATLAVKDALSAASNPTAASSLGINLSLGSSKSQSSSTTQSNTAAGSTVKAGGNVTITATGAGEQSNVIVQGSTISAGNKATLKADGQVLLQAAENTREEHSTNSASSASLGVSFGAGGQSGVGFNASASRINGSADGSEVSWTNAHLTAGNTVVIESAGDTTLRGAVVSANTVQAKIGGQLNIESLQDTSTYAGKQSSAGVGVSVCMPPLCYGTSSMSVSASNAKASGDYASVIEQSGIKTGDGGYQLNVDGVTHLTGGVIASTSTASQQHKNVLVTEALVQSDIQNRDSYSASGYSIGATFSGAMGDQSTAKPGAQKAAADAAANAKPAGSAGIGSASGSQGSTTFSGISGGTITITNDAKQQMLTGKSASDTIAATNRNVTTSTDTTGAIAKALNGGQLMTDVQAQVQITAAFGQTASTAWGTYANDQLVNAKTSEDAACWGPSGTCRAAGHGLIGALGSGAAGAVGAAGASMSVTQLGAAIYNLGLPDTVSQGLTQAIVLGAAGAAGSGAAAAGAYNEASNNSLALLMQLAQLGARVAQQGVAAVSAEGQILLMQCARTTCSVVLPAAAIAALAASKVAITPGSLVDQIPTGYPVPPPNVGGGTTVSPTPAPSGGNTTTTPGMGVTGAGSTPGYDAGAFVTSNNTTVTPATPSGSGSIIVMNANGQHETVNLPSLVDSQGATHILNGDRPGSGGHLWPGQPGKSAFPADWSAERILGAVSDVATDPSVTWSRPDARGYVTAVGIRSGVDIKVVVDTQNGRIVTGYPTNLPRNPK